MKKVAKAWQKVNLDERIVRKIVDLSFEEKDWFRIMQEQDDINILVDYLFAHDIISETQFHNWYICQEWTTAKKIADFKVDQPIGVSMTDRKRLRNLSVSIANLENKVNEIINRYKK